MQTFMQIFYNTEIGKKFLYKIFEKLYSTHSKRDLRELSVNYLNKALSSLRF